MRTKAVNKYLQQTKKLISRRRALQLARLKKDQNAIFIGEKLKTKSLMFFVSFFNVICKISNFNM